MKTDQTWECPKCKATYVPALPATSVSKSCPCGNKKPWKLVGPPAKKRGGVASSKTKET